MPKIVHHDQRREEIAAAVLRLVARQGIRGVTMREVAAEAGWSTGVLNHYFENKQELLMGGLRLAASEVGTSVDRAMKAKSGRDRLRAVLEAGMPLDERRAALCRIFFYFWAEGIGDPDLAVRLANYYDWWRGRIREVIEQGQTEGWIHDRDAKALAEMSVAMADGVAVQAVFTKRSMSRRRQRCHVEAWLDLLAPGSS